MVTITGLPRLNRPPEPRLHSYDPNTLGLLSGRLGDEREGGVLELVSCAPSALQALSYAPEALHHEPRSDKAETVSPLSPISPISCKPYKAHKPHTPLSALSALMKHLSQPQDAHTCVVSSGFLLPIAKPRKCSNRHCPKCWYPFCTPK